MSKVVKVRYEGGMFKPLEPVDLDEGEEVLITIKRDVRKVLEKYRGVLGRSSIKELLELEEEAHWQ
ncbi:MAG: antitoxin family protein [Desulfurococcales archaeon]|nr:antitoxin family protein [Desulfurococcales archaeon]